MTLFIWKLFFTEITSNSTLFTPGISQMFAVILTQNEKEMKHSGCQWDRV